MNQKLQQLLDAIQLSAHLSEDEKNALVKTVKEVDKEIEITAFKLDRTEKVKRTTAILLEETIEELEQKRKAVEAQNKELEIEASLERVRAVAMGMMKPDDLLQIARAQFTELKQLGFTEIRNSLIGIFHDAQDYFMDYDYSDFSGGNINKIPYHKNPVIDRSLKQMKSATDAFTEFTVEGAALEEWKAFRKQNGEYDDTRIEDSEALYYYFYSISQGNLGISTFKKISEDQLTILKRFRNVFDLAYKRYVDISNAEAQAKEAQVELALERVRARTMAMHHSNELSETSSILFQQIKELGFETWSCGFCIWTKNDMAELWMGADSGGLLPPMMIPYKQEPTHRDIYEAFLQKKSSHHRIWEGEALENHYEFLQTIPSVKTAIEQLKNAGLSLPVKQCYYVGFFRQGYLLLITKEPNAALEDLSKRFASVFDLTYTRFLDLQKAEAQSRESKIQLALERGRTQSMIMQHSTELDDTLRVFHEQVLSLSIPSAFSFLWLPDEHKERHIFWAAWAENNSTVFQSKAINYPLDRNEPATAQCLIDWKSDEPVVAYHVPPQSVKDYFAAWSQLFGSAKDLKPENFSDGLYYIEAFMKYGCFGVMVKHTITEEENKILGRFAVEFERAYTRFLDLQKAEAQAREAQIETALERVRSRSMGMQKSDELKEIIQVVFEQFLQLDIKVEHTGFIIDYKERDDMHIWLADRHTIPFEITIPYFDSPHWNSFKNAKEKGIDLFTNQLDFEEKNKFYRDLFQHVTGISEEIKEYYLGCPGLAISTVLLDNVGLYTENFSGIPFTSEENATLMRFGKVFQQTYTRFLDLQKAEAQSRESQIELSLERVRAKTMAMHNSADVGETAAVMVEELKKLGIDTVRCGIGIMHEPGDMEVWTISTDENNKTNIIIGWLDMHLHPLLHGAFESWRSKNDSYSYDLNDDDLLAYYNAINNYPGYPIRYDTASLPNRIHHNEFYFPEGILFAFSLEQLSPEQRKIFIRFAGVFGQTYRRYLDLKKAEAQAKESQIEVALERVRSRTLAMQKSDELAETAAVLFQQLIALGIEPNRLYISIVKDENGASEFWITDEDGTKISTAFSANLDDNPSFDKMFEGWKQQKKSLVIDMQGDELKNYFRHLTSLGVPFKGGLTQKRRVQEVAYFSKGFIGIASPEVQPPDTLQLLERFAAVFNLTFTRFNDLKIAEAHALQAEQDLVAIKDAKQKAEQALTELQSAQKQLIQSEKMASLGELTAGIAHEIQNPLNFVNNFSEVSGELLDEMMEEVSKGNYDEVKEILQDVKKNLEKINHHGKRADGIVKGMLQHSRSSSNQKEPTNINALADEYLRLAYHGLRAKDKTFNAILKTDFDETIGHINVIPQDIGRVLLNLITNAFYAVSEKARLAVTNLAAVKYEPVVSINTKRKNGGIEITISDNGNGIPKNILDKIFQPFFTTKPTGQGTGLGLSLCYDIMKAHNGTIKVESVEGQGAVFIIELPGKTELII